MVKAVTGPDFVTGCRPGLLSRRFSLGRFTLTRITLGRLALAVALAAWLLLPRPAAAVLFHPQTFTLKNGMQVVVIPNHRAPIVSHMVWYKVGAADAPPGKSGIAHFLEHLMFKGTDKLAPGEFSRIIAANGGQENAFTAQDYTAYYQDIARSRLKLVMGLEADRMAHLRLSDKVVLPERQVVLEERRMRIDNDPGARLAEEADATLFLHHPYGNPVIGWKDEIETLSTRDELAFYRRWYAPNNAILVVSGDITAAQLKPLAEATYGRIPARPVPVRRRVQEPPPEAQRTVVLHDSQVRQPSWSRTYLAPSYHAGEKRFAYALEILDEILGDGATSRLYKTLVVKDEMAVNAGSDYSPSALDLGRFVLYATPRPEVSIDKLQAGVQAIIADVVKNGVSAAEVADAKRRMIERDVYARDAVQTAAYVFGMALTTGRTVADVEAWPDRIQAVTPQEVNQAAKLVFHPNASVTAILLPEGATTARPVPAPTGPAPARPVTLPSQIR